MARSGFHFEFDGTYVIIIGVDFVERRMYDGLNRVKRVQHLLASGEILLCSIQIRYPQLGIGDVGERIDVRIL